MAGVFVGGAGTRMGRVAKGMLGAPGGGTLIERWLEVLRAAAIDEVILVGRDAAYAELPLDVLDDEPRGIGPLGGLVALLRYAAGRPSLAVACDMPFVSESLVARLLEAPPAPVVAPRRGDRWEPLCARYDPARVLPLARAHVAAGDHSLQRLLHAAGAQVLMISAEEERELHDWDRPEDMS